MHALLLRLTDAVPAAATAAVGGPRGGPPALGMCVRAARRHPRDREELGGGLWRGVVSHRTARAPPPSTPDPSRMPNHWAMMAS